jgi:ribosomal protein S18 acetylase RimI-like enzyme
VIAIETPDARDKSPICESILRALPDWFAIETALMQFVQEAADLPMLVAVDDAAAIGFITLRQHSACAWEVHAIAVRPQQHRRGIGRRLLAEAERLLRDRAAEFLAVKTLSGSAEYEPYDRTRAFYSTMGFRPLMELPTLWSAENPCLVMIKPLAASRAHRRFRDPQLVIASHNAGKAREIAELLSPFGVEVISAGSLKLPEPDETETHSSAMNESSRRRRIEPAGTGRRFRARGPRARRRARHLLGTLGRADEGFLRRHGPRAARAGGHENRRPTRPLRRRALSMLARRPLRVIQGPGRRRAGMATARHPRIRL